MFINIRRVLSKYTHLHIHPNRMRLNRSVCFVAFCFSSSFFTFVKFFFQSFSNPKYRQIVLTCTLQVKIRFFCDLNRVEKEQECSYSYKACKIPI